MGTHTRAAVARPIVVPPQFKPLRWTRITKPLRLSPQQANIVALLLQGRRDKQIAAALGVSPATVRTHLRCIFARLGVTDRVELVLRVFDASVWSGDPNDPDSTILIDANFGSYTWTVGQSAAPATVQVVGINPTDYEQVKFTLSVIAAPKVYGVPVAAPAAPAGQPQSDTQVATVPGKGGYLAAFDGTWTTAANNSDIHQFYKAYKGVPADYVPGVGSNDQHPLEALLPWTWPNVIPRLFSGAFGGLEAAVQWNTEWDKLAKFYSDPSNEGVPFDTIGWSRGACIAVNLANRVANQAIQIRTPNEVINFHPVIRFVGIISDVNQMGPIAGNWPTSLPVGVEAMFQALDNVPTDGAFPQITLEEADGTANNGNTIYSYSHGAIGYAADVLTAMETFARMFGVPV